MATGSRPKQPRAPAGVPTTQLWGLYRALWTMHDPHAERREAGDPPGHSGAQLWAAGLRPLGAALCVGVLSLLEREHLATLGMHDLLPVMHACR